MTAKRARIDKAFAFNTRYWRTNIDIQLMTLRQRALLMDRAADAALSGDPAELAKYPFLRPWREYKGSRAPVPKAVRRSVLERDGHACVFCGASEDLQLDHIHLWSQGGKHTEENLRVLCRRCNLRRNCR